MAKRLRRALLVRSVFEPKRRYPSFIGTRRWKIGVTEPGDYKCSNISLSHPPPPAVCSSLPCLLSLPTPRPARNCQPHASAEASVLSKCERACRNVDVLSVVRCIRWKWLKLSLCSNDVDEKRPYIRSQETIAVTLPSCVAVLQRGAIKMAAFHSVSKLLDRQPPPHSRPLIRS